MPGRDYAEMERAFLGEFQKWWPFARERLAEGGFVKFTIALEVKGRDGDYFVQGNLDYSEKVKRENAGEQRGAGARNHGDRRGEGDPGSEGEGRPHLRRVT